MEFHGKIDFINTLDDKLIYEWDCYNVDLPFIPPINSCIILSQSSITIHQEIKVESVTFTDKDIYILFYNIVYPMIHTSISEMLKEFKEGLDVWLNSHRCSGYNIEIDEIEEKDYQRVEKLLLEKFDKAHKSNYNFYISENREAYNSSKGGKFIP